MLRNLLKESGRAETVGQFATEYLASCPLNQNILVLRQFRFPLRQAIPTVAVQQYENYCEQIAGHDSTVHTIENLFILLTEFGKSVAVGSVAARSVALVIYDYPSAKSMNLLFRNRKRKTGRGSSPVCTENGGQLADLSQQHREIFEVVRDATMTSAQRVAALCEAVDYVCRSGIEGDIVECGVWKGGSMMAVAKTLIQNGVTDRRLWLFDTFAGMSPPSDLDCDYHGVAARTLLDQADKSIPSSVWCCAGLEEVRNRLQSTGYPLSRIQFVVGDVEQTLLEPVNQPVKISLLRLDTDWYHSTRIELEQLFPLLSPGGVLIIDDYGHWEGCRKAVDEYFATNQIRIFLHQIDYTGRMGIKQVTQVDGNGCNAA